MPFSRYDKFIENGTMKLVPFISIPEKESDCFEYYQRGVTRFDLLSYKYYNDPNYGWLILQANPELPPYEFSIKNNTRIRIPYPLESTLIQYKDDIDTYDKLYGLN